MKIDISAELLKEKDLWGLCRSAKNFPTSKLNFRFTLLVSIFVSIYLILTDRPYPSIADDVREMSAYGFGFSTSILSFLIAGFTIFFTIAKSDFLVFLAHENEKTTNTPWLKYSALLFIRVIAFYIFFCILCVLIKIFASPGGAASLLFQIEYLAFIKEYVAKGIFLIVATSFVYMIMLLQSFVFNIYHVTMLSVVWEIEKPKKESDK